MFDDFDTAPNRDTAGRPEVSGPDACMRCNGYGWLWRGDYCGEGEMERNCSDCDGSGRADAQDQQP